MGNAQSRLDEVYQACEEFLSQWRQGDNPEMEWFCESSQSRAIATDLMQNFFRYRGFIDWVFDELVKKPNKRALKEVIKLAMAQLVFHSGIEPSHLVNAIVNRIKQQFGPREGSFSNGVLRNFIREYPQLMSSGSELEISERLRAHFGNLYNKLFLGKALYEHWKKQLGLEKVAEIVKELELIAPVTVRLKAGDDNIELPDYLEPLQLDEWAEGARVFVCKKPNEFFDDSELLNHFYVQDPSTLAAPLMTAEKEDGVYGDFCAAPGGKTLLIAENVQSGKIYSCDVNKGRIRRLKENLMSCVNVEIKRQDALKPVFDPDSFDGILLDVPCSNTGVIRRRPDVKWRFSKKNLKELAEQQFKIVEKSVPLIRDGGCLIYSTCSIDQEENSEQVKKILAAFPNLTLEKELKIYPSACHDGGFAAKFRVS